MQSRLVWALLCFSASGVLAQLPKARLGVFAGMNQSRIGGSATEISNHSGASAGAYVALPFSGAWSFQTGAAWSQKGWEHSDSRDQNVIKIDYVELPALLRYDFARAARLGAFTYFGPAFGFRGACSYSAISHANGSTFGVSCDEIERQSNGNQRFNSFDIGGIGGLAARYAAGRVNLTATAQYNYGFKAIGFGDNKNRAATFGVGLEIPLSAGAAATR
jgi:hypothetical protein